MAITTKEMECCVAHYFGTRRNIIVPCVSWGWIINHECDLVVITKARYAYEVEIKISASDLRADFKKSHGHKSYLIKRLYYAIPIDMRAYVNLIPDYCGVIIVGSRDKIFDLRHELYGNKYCSLSTVRSHGEWYAVKFREAQNKGNTKIAEKDVTALTRLGLLRYWSQRGV